jgi:hypothetical protein
MALDCFCHRCNGQEETEDNFFEECWNENSQLQLKKVELNNSSNNIYYFSFVAFFILLLSFFLT